MVTLNLEKFPFENGETYLCRVKYTEGQNAGMEEWVVAWIDNGSWYLNCPNAECGGRPLADFDLEILSTQKLPSVSDEAEKFSGLAEPTCPYCEAVDSQIEFSQRELEDEACKPATCSKCGKNFEINAQERVLYWMHKVD